MRSAATVEGRGPAGKARLWGPVAAWMGCLFWASSQSDIGVAARVPDTLTHGTAYLVLGLLVCRAVSGGLDGWLSIRGAAVVILVCTLYGVSDEFHQSFVPGRDASAGDVAKDFGGAALAALAWRLASARARAGRPGTG